MKNPLTPQLALAFKRVYQRLDVYREAAMDVNPKELAMLMHLAEYGPCRVKTLCDALDLPLSTLSWTADKMVGKGLLNRKPDPDDRRAIILEVAKAGQKAVDKNNEIFDRVALLVAERLSQKKFEEILVLVENLAETLEK